MPDPEERRAASNRGAGTYSPPYERVPLAVAESWQEALNAAAAAVAHICRQQQRDRGGAFQRGEMPEERVKQPPTDMAEEDDGAICSTVARTAVGAPPTAADPGTTAATAALMAAGNSRNVGEDILKAGEDGDDRVLPQSVVDIGGTGGESRMTSSVTAIEAGRGSIVGSMRIACDTNANIRPSFLR